MSPGRALAVFPTPSLQHTLQCASSGLKTPLTLPRRWVISGSSPVVEFRASSGLVSCDMFMRTSAGLVQVDPQFRTAIGLIDCGGFAAASLTATASPDSVYGSVARNRPASVATNATTVSVTGGMAPYSFAWAADPDWIVSSPSSATTSFSAIVSPDQEQSATFICTVTDAKGIATTASVFASVSNYYSGGGVAQIQ